MRVMRAEPVGGGLVARRARPLTPAEDAALRRAHDLAGRIAAAPRGRPLGAGLCAAFDAAYSACAALGLSPHEFTRYGRDTAEGGGSGAGAGSPDPGPVVGAATSAP